MTHATELQRRLAAHGIALSRQAVFRLITAGPERLSLPTLVAICEIFACTPNDLIQLRRSEDDLAEMRAPPRFELHRTRG